MRLLALDFDGVICDSAPETFVVGLRTYVGLHPSSRFSECRDLLCPEPPSAARIRADQLYRAFVELMPLGNRAEDFGVVLAALDAGEALPDQPGYDLFRSRLPDPWLARFHERFYLERASLAERSPEGWHALMACYSELLALLRRRDGAAELAIATAKDRASVRALLARYGASELFPEERVLDKETGVSKLAHLELLAERCGVPFPEITFVDDKLNHLQSAATLGVRCALASWGYNGPREAAAARDRGFLVCTLQDFEAQIFSQAVPENGPRARDAADSAG